MTAPDVTALAQAYEDVPQRPDYDAEVWAEAIIAALAASGWRLTSDFCDPLGPYCVPHDHVDPGIISAPEPFAGRCVCPEDGVYGHLDNCPEQSGDGDTTAAVSDLDAIPARHVRTTYEPARPGEAWCGQSGQPWPCDSAIVLAALAERQSTNAALNTMLLEAEGRWTAALARERRLREAAQELYEQASDPFPDEWIDAESSIAMGVTVTGRALAAVRAALAEPEAGT